METNPNNNEQSEPSVVSLTSFELAAIEKRYLGKSYETIAAELAGELGTSISTGTLRQWFMRGGRLSGLYLQYAAIQNEGRILEARIYFHSCIAEAVEAFREILADPKSPHRFQTAVEVMNRLWGKEFVLAASEDEFVKFSLGSSFGQKAEHPKSEADKVIEWARKVAEYHQNKKSKDSEKM